MQIRSQPGLFKPRSSPPFLKKKKNECLFILFSAYQKNAKPSSALKLMTVLWGTEHELFLKPFLIIFLSRIIKNPDLWSTMLFLWSKIPPFFASHIFRGAERTFTTEHYSSHMSRRDVCNTRSRSKSPELRSRGSNKACRATSLLMTKRRRGEGACCSP